MKFFLIADTHLNHNNIATYCQRPANFTNTIIKQWNERVSPDDTVIHLGDVAIGPRSTVEHQIRSLAGRKILIRGNHDRSSSCSWWMDRGFDFCCDAMMFRDWWLTHEPAQNLPWEQGKNCAGNIHGHLHNIWDGFGSSKEYPSLLYAQLKNPWQRLFSVEYTGYYPIEFDEFVNHPDRYQSRGPKKDPMLSVSV